MKYVAFIAIWLPSVAGSAWLGCRLVDLTFDVWPRRASLAVSLGAALLVFWLLLLADIALTGV